MMKKPRTIIKYLLSMPVQRGSFARGIQRGGLSSYGSSAASVSLGLPKDKDLSVSLSHHIHLKDIKTWQAATQSQNTKLNTNTQIYISVYTHMHV